MILPEFFEACEGCGEPFEENTTYPVLTTEGEDGAMEVYSFCDDECLSAWREETSREPLDENERGGAEA